MTKAEIRANAKNRVAAEILTAIDGLTKIGDYTWGIQVGTAEDNGNPVYVKIDVSCPNWYATAKSNAFNLNEKVAEYEAKLAEDERKAAEKAAKAAEKA